jgi:AbrB family looped-hinge helix DNA binding protein
MSKVTSKYQVTLPKAIAQRYGIRPGDDIDWAPAGDAIRVTPSGSRAASDDRESRLRLFDQATERHRQRMRGRKLAHPAKRGWTREDLYGRGRSR